MDDILTHLDESGAARMVDVSHKNVSHRSATACARIKMNEVALRAIHRNELKKGDALTVARVAGIMAAKRTDELIPLCHSLPLAALTVNFQFEDAGIYIEATATTDARTGVEMEALTACSVAALTIYDMAKSLDRSMEIHGVKLLNKVGGSSGEYIAPVSNE